MSAPVIKKVTPSSTTWVKDVTYHFDASGSHFAATATVKMTDTHATWAAPAYTQRTADHIKFHTYPTNIKAASPRHHVPETAGALTITVTNPLSPPPAKSSIHGTYITRVTTTPFGPPHLKIEVEVDASIWVTSGCYHFGLEGGPFVEGATVHLEDDRAEWHPAHVDTCTAGRIRFHSHPTRLRDADGQTSGALTITVKGPGGEVAARGKVEGSYDGA